MRKEDMKICYMCGNEISDDPIKIDGKFYCRRCFENDFTKCEHCGKYILKERSTTHHVRMAGLSINDRRYAKFYLCDDCFQEYEQCEICRCYELKSDLKEILHFKHVCKICMETEFYKCDNCGELFYSGDISSYDLYMTPRENLDYPYSYDKMDHMRLCDDCSEQLLFRCHHCGVVFYKKTFDEITVKNDYDSVIRSYCPPCYHRHAVLHEYSFKPSYTIYRRDKENKVILFGTENEIEVDRGSMRDDDSRELLVHLEKQNQDISINVEKRIYIANAIDKNFHDFIYQKRDGSINYGLELITHPASLNYLYDMRGEMEKLFGILKDCDCFAENAAPNTGMHVHISKNKMTDKHRMIFSTFVYRHGQKIKLVAGRNSRKYSRFLSVPKERTENALSSRFLKADSYSDRYVAINWRNRETVEVRIFQSTLNTDRFYANLEFCDAIYKYTQMLETVSEIFKRNSWILFCRFIELMNYEYLMNYMQTINVWRVK